MNKKLLQLVMCLCMALIVATSISIPVFATEFRSGEVSSQVDPRNTNGFSWKNEQTSVYLSGNMKKVNYTGIITSGQTSESYVVLRFTNNRTGDSYTQGFICDGGTYTRNLGQTYPEGNYTVTFVTATPNVSVNITVSFLNR